MTSASSAAPDPGRSRRPWGAIALLAVLFTAHVVQAFRLVPPRALLDDDCPVLVVDHALHIYHGALGSEFLREHGTTWGYDPFFMAGYPETPIWDSSSNLSILFQLLAGGGYHPRAYNIGLFASELFVLACIPAGAVASGLGLWEAALATLLAWVYFHCGWPDALWRTGIFGFLVASAGGVLLAGLLLRFERRPSFGRWCAAAATGTGIWFAHVTAPIVALGAVLGFGGGLALRRAWRPLAAMAAAAGLALAVNLVWLVPLWRFRGIRKPLAFFMTPQTGWFLVDDYLSERADSRLSLVILVFGVAGLAAWLRDGRRLLAATFGGAAAVCLALAAFGGGWDVTMTLEPYRFKATIHLFLAVPAGSALVRGTARLARALGGGRRGAWLAACAWGVALGAAVVARPGLFFETARKLTIPRPLVAGFRPEMRQLVRWLRENTDGSARILFEDQLRLLENTDPESTHWTPLLPALLGDDRRQFIGGLYQTAFITHHRLASFGDYQLGGRPIESWRPDRLFAYCERYNIGWVVCWSPVSRFCFDHWGRARLVATLPRYCSPNRPGSRDPHERKMLLQSGGPAAAARYLAEGEGRYAIYRVERPHSFFLRGEGRVVRVDPNRIELADVVPKDGAATISLHWLDTWRTDPPLPLAPAPVPDDPVPMVRISADRPLGRVVLYNDYGRPQGTSD